MPVMGWLSDRTSRDIAIVLSFSGVSAGLILLLVGDGFWLVLAGVIVTGMGISWGGSLQSRFMDYFSESERGTGFGIVRSVTGVLGATGSVIIGVIADMGGWAPAFGLLVVLLLVTVIVMGANRAIGPGW